jgi:hypothetical protein
MAMKLNDSPRAVTRLPDDQFDALVARHDQIIEHLRPISEWARSQMALAQQKTQASVTQETEEKRRAQAEEEAEDQHRIEVERAAEQKAKGERAEQVLKQQIEEERRASQTRPVDSVKRQPIR